MTNEPEKIILNARAQAQEFILNNQLKIDDGVSSAFAPAMRLMVEVFGLAAALYAQEADVSIDEAIDELKGVIDGLGTIHAKNCDKARKMAMRQVREGATTSITHSIFK